jgi:hypothetical protein
MLFQRNAPRDGLGSQVGFGFRADFDQNRHGSASCVSIICSICGKMEGLE